jgi:hypothetical protein
MGVESLLAPFMRQADLCKLPCRSSHLARPGRVAGRVESVLLSAHVAAVLVGLRSRLVRIRGRIIGHSIFGFSGGGLALVCGRYGKAGCGLPVVRRELYCQRNGRVAQACAECPAASTSIPAVARLSGGITSRRRPT